MTNIGFILDYGASHPEAIHSLLSLISGLDNSGIRCSLYLPGKKVENSKIDEILLEGNNPTVSNGMSPHEFFKEQRADFIVTYDSDSCMSIASNIKRRLGIPSIIHSMTLGDWPMFFATGYESFNSSGILLHSTPGHPFLVHHRFLAVLPHMSLP